MTGILLMLFASVAVATGQFFWKLSAGQWNFWLVSGFVTYGAGAIAMLLAFRHGKLSVLHAMMAFGYVFSFFLAVFILHEPWSIKQVIGILLIMAGIVLLGSKKN